MRRAFRRHRRLLAGLAAAVAVLAALTVIRGNTDEVPVLVAAREIPAGTVLADTDVSVARWPADLVPQGALGAAEDAVGKTVASAIPAKGPVTRSSFPDSGALVREGMVAMPVKFGSGAPIDLLHVGDRIDLIGSASDGTQQVLVSGAQVVAMPSSGSGGGMFAGESPGVVLVEVTSSQAATLAGAAGLGGLSFALL